MNIKERLLRTWQADLRSLAVFRIITGLTLITDLLDKIFRYSEFYSDKGVFPNLIAKPFVSEFGRFSLHTISTSGFYQFILFSIAVIGALMIIFGYQTKWATLVSWILFMSLENRYFLPNYPGDYMIRMALMWGMFLPLDERFSVKAFLNRHTTKGEGFISLPSVLFFVFVFVFMFTAGLSKNGASWKDGQALYFLLQSPKYASGILDFLYSAPELLRFLTMTVPYGEIIGTLLLFFPFCNGPVRTLCSIGFVFMFLGFHLGLDIHVLAYMGMGFYTALLPPWFWTQIVDRRILRRAQFTTQSQLDVEPLTANKLVTGRNFIAASLLAITLLLYFVKVEKFGYYSVSGAVTVPQSIDRFAKFIRLHNIWRMFQDPRTLEQGWDVFSGTLINGEKVNVLTEKEVDWNQPENYEEYIGGFRMRRHLDAMNWGQTVIGLKLTGEKVNVRSEELDDIAGYLRTAYNNYLCGKWNSKNKGDRRLQSFQTIQVKKEVTYLQGWKITDKKVLDEYECP